MLKTAQDFNAQDALVGIMIAVSASDETIRTSELVTIERIVGHLPAFGGYDDARIRHVATVVFDLFEEEDGLDQLFAAVRAVLPRRNWETAYALACDVVAADGETRETELRMLEEMRYELEIDRLHAAAIERGARARHTTL